MKPTPYGLRRLPAMTATREDFAAKPAGGLQALARLGCIGVIRNPRSHRNKGVEPECLDEPNVMTAMPRSKPELADALARFAREGIEVLVIDGGDGTVRDVLTRAAPAFGERWPRIVVLPKGKTNALAVDLGLPRKWRLTEALEAALRGRTVTRRPLLIQRLDAEQRDRLGFILAAGVFNEALRAGQVAHRFGAFQSFAIAVTAIFGVSKALFGIGDSPWRKGSPMRISADGQAELPESARAAPGSRFLAGFSTLTRFPLGLRPFPAPTEPDQIQYFIVDAPLRRAVAMLPSALFGRHTAYTRSLGIHYGAVPGFGLKLADRFILDGETFPAGDYRVSLGPELQFIVP